MRGLIGLVVLGAGLALAGPAAAADQVVTFPNSSTFGSYSYSPATPTIKTGDAVTFSGSFANHPLVWDDGSSPVTNTGSSASFRFAQPRTYAFHCMLHSGPPNNMFGSVTVLPDQHPATVSFGVSPSPRAGQPVTFTYTGSADPDGTLTSWKWDLDGDGAFETTTASGAATTTYATARTVTVRMYAVDDSGEASATAEQAVTIAAAGSGGGGGTSGSGNSGSQDTTAPKATLVKLSGLKLTFRASEKASATATLRARGKTIAKGSAKAKSGAISLRLKVTKAGRSMLKPGHKLKATLNLTLRDAGGNRRSLKKTVTVRRP
jgi:plastocyanin